MSSWNLSSIISLHNIFLFKPCFPLFSALGKFHSRSILSIVALPCLPEQITEAMLPWEQSGTARAVTGHFHRKDSVPEQWNRAFQSWSLPSAPFGVEMAIPQPSWQQTTLALARLQWEAQSALQCPEIYISTCPSHWEVSFFISRTSVYTDRKRQDFSTIWFLFYLEPSVHGG